MYLRSQITAICEKQSKFVNDIGVNVRRETTLLYLQILMFSLFNHKYILYFIVLYVHFHQLAS